MSRIEERGRDMEKKYEEMRREEEMGSGGDVERRGESKR